jgi:hypothetical protein
VRRKTVAIDLLAKNKTIERRVNSMGSRPV